MKIVKITGYVICEDDTNEDALAGVIQRSIPDSCDGFGKQFRTDSTEIPDWDDDHPLNSIDCSAETCEKFWKSKI